MFQVSIFKPLSVLRITPGMERTDTRKAPYWDSDVGNGDDVTV